MANTIGTAALILKADTIQLTGGLNKARGEIQSFSGSVGSWAASAANAIVGLARAGFDLVGRMTAMVQTRFHETLTSITEANRSAQALGVPTSFIQSLSLAGLETRAVTQGMLGLER